MSEEDDVMVIACARIADAGDRHTSDAVRGNCAVCDEPVWVSQSSFDIMATHEAQLVCVHCIKWPEVKGIKPISEEQKQEIRKYNEQRKNDTTGIRDPTNRRK